MATTREPDYENSKGGLVQPNYQTFHVPGPTVLANDTPNPDDPNKYRLRFRYIRMSRKGDILCDRIFVDEYYKRRGPRICFNERGDAMAHCNAPAILINMAAARLKDSAHFQGWVTP